jgi:glycerol-3-phosphate acyltransferase PlsY
MNTNLKSFLAIIIVVLIGYLIGSLIFGIIIGKIFKKDPREFASKSAGATNVTRVMGRIIGSLVAVLDCAKCFLAIFISKIVIVDALQLDIYQIVYISGVFCVIGHCWPIYFKFKGGKGVSTAGALMLCISPVIGLSMFGSWWIIMLSTTYISIASISIIIIAVPLTFVQQMYILNSYPFGNSIESYGADDISKMTYFFAILFFTAVIVVYKHKDNISRLLNKQENRSKMALYITGRKSLISK